MSEILFTACTSQVAHLAQVLQAITTAKAQAILQITAEGINLITETNHICKIRLTLDKTLFTSYTLVIPEEADDLRVELAIDLNSISDCFNMANQNYNTTTHPASNGGASMATLNLFPVQCVISYRSVGEPLVVDFKDDQMNERVEFLTFHLETLEQDTVLCVDHLQLVYEMMLKSDVLFNILKDLKDINTEDLFIYVSKGGANEVNFISRGEIGYSKMMFPQERSILEELLLYGDARAVMSRYNYPILYKILRAVRLSHKTKIMKDSQGLISFHLLINNHELTNYQGTIIEFNILEMSVEEGDLELNTLLEDTQGSREASLLGDTEAPNTTAVSVFAPAITQAPYEEREPAHAIQVDESMADDRDERQLETYGGAVELPLFF